MSGNISNAILEELVLKYRGVKLQGRPLEEALSLIGSVVVHLLEEVDAARELRAVIRGGRAEYFEAMNRYDSIRTRNEANHD